MNNFNARERFPESEYTDILDQVEKIKINGPATIVFWKDRTKTVAKTQTAGSYADPVIGFLMCIFKKYMSGKDYTRLCDQMTDIYQIRDMRIRDMLFDEVHRQTRLNEITNEVLKIDETLNPLEDRRNELLEEYAKVMGFLSFE